MTRCSRATKNESLFAEVERALTSSSSSREFLGGNSVVMVRRLVTEGVERVMLGADVPRELRSQLDSRVRGDCYCR